MHRRLSTALRGLAMAALAGSAVLALPVQAIDLPPTQAQATPAPAPAPGAAPAADGAAPSILAGAYTAEQALRGKDLYFANCALCHGNQLRGSPGGPGLGGGEFVNMWTGRTVGEMFQFAVDNMPPGRAGSLPHQQYADIIAFVIEQNGWPAGTTELPTDVTILDQITFEPVPKN